MKLILLNGLFISIFLATAFRLTEQTQQWERVIYLLMLVFLMIQFFRFKNRIKIDYKTFVLIYSYVLVSGISSIVNSDIKLLQGALILFLLYFASFVVMPSFSVVYINKLVFRTALVVYTLTVIVPLLLNGVESVPYQGIFYNTNSLGIFSTGIFTMVLSMFSNSVQAYIEKTNNSKTFLNMLFYLALLITVFFLVVLSGSRTSFLTCIVVLFISFVYLFYCLLKKGKIIKIFNRGTLAAIPIILLVFLISKLTSLSEFIYLNIIDKFQVQMAEGNMLTNRMDIWVQTIKDATLFGNGVDYFNNTFIYGSHNTFINILGQYGWISFILYIALVLFLIIYSLKYTFQKTDDKYKLMPLVLTICFVCLSMTENISYSLIMIAMFFSVGSIVFSSAQKKIIT